MKEKVTQAASDTLGSAERNAIATEINELTTEINNIVAENIVAETTFNDRALLDGTYTGISFQTGEDTTNTLVFGISQVNTSAGLGVDSGNVSSLVFTASGSSTALSNVDLALETIAASLQAIGATVSRLGVKESTLSISITNTESARSRIMDADIASEQLESTKLQILQQTATAQLAQANVAPQNVLALFT